MMLCFLFSALIVALDQFFKRWVIRTMELGDTGTLIPGFIGLRYWENDGAMLNFLSGQQWLLAGIAFVVSVILVMILLRYDEGFWGTIGLAAVLGGTVGNLCDRIFNDGKVIDMFETLFIRFPIFNIADIFITLGFITFLIHFIALTLKPGEISPAKNKSARETETDEDIPMPSKISVPADPDLADIVERYSEQPQNTQPVYQQTYIPEAPQVYAPVQTSSPQVIPDAAVYAEPVYEQPSAQLPISPPTDGYDLNISNFESATDTTPDITFEADEFGSELDSIDVDYDVDEILREYGIESNDYNV